MGTDEYVDLSFDGCSNIHLTHLPQKMVNTNGYWSSHKNNEVYKMSTSKVVCAICGKVVSECALSSHLKWNHNILFKQYIDTYVEPYFHKCPYCDRERKWFGKAGIRYRECCGSKECKSKCYSEHNQGGTQSSICKIKNTKQKRYGNPNFNNHQKIQDTCTKRYGVKNVASLPEIRRKMNETYFKRTGNLYVGGCNTRSKIFYDGLWFDSKHEMFYYHWCLENDLEITQHPKGIPYFIGDVQHTYYPDFRVQGRLVEIKGMDIINKNGILLDKITKQELWEKTACLFDNDVEIITQVQVEKYFKPSNWKEILSKAKRKGDLLNEQK